MVGSYDIYIVAYQQVIIQKYHGYDGFRFIVGQYHGDFLEWLKAYFLNITEYHGSIFTGKMDKN